MKDATDATRVANRAALAQVPLADRQSFDDARRGFVEALGDKLIMRGDGRLVWTLKGYEFQKSTFASAIQSGQIAVTGKSEKLIELLEMLDTFPIRFPVVEPRPTI